MSAPELSPEEQRIVARFEAAPTPPEVLREQVADALSAPLPDWRGGSDREYWLARADAALAVFRGQQDPAVQRVLDVHRRFVDSYGITHDWCAHDPGDSWPCPTVAAIGGDGR